MATQYAFGKIVTNGLVLALDAADRNSYVSGSTTWTDLSGNGINGTLTGSTLPTFSSSSGGRINLNGTNQYVTFPGNTFNYSPGTTGEVTLEVWITPNGPFTSYGSEPPTTNLGGIIGQGFFANSVGWGLGVLVVNSGSYNWSFQVRNTTNIVNISGSFTTGSQYHVVGSFKRNDLSRLYVNGVLLASSSSVRLNGVDLTPSLADASIGRAGNGVFYSGFSINKSAIYSRALTAEEVLQNYNAQKARFGLT
jgi:hypothetical protein